MRRTWGLAMLPFAQTGSEFTAPNPPAGALHHLSSASRFQGQDRGEGCRRGWEDRSRDHRAGDGRHSPHQLGLRPAGEGGGRFGGRGAAMVKPGKYTVTLAKVEGKEVTLLDEPRIVEIVPLVSTSATALP